jgi:transcriptional regulator with XRE-family HTH domain
VPNALDAELSRALVAEIRKQRKARSWSQETLASAAELHRSFVGLLEADKRGLSVAAASSLARALDVKLSDLVSLAEQALPSATSS